MNEDESDYEDPYPSIDSANHSSSNNEGEESIASSSNSSVSASSEESDSEYVPADGENSDESADRHSLRSPAFGFISNQPFQQGIAPAMCW